MGGTKVPGFQGHHTVPLPSSSQPHQWPPTASLCAVPSLERRCAQLVHCCQPLLLDPQVSQRIALVDIKPRATPFWPVGLIPFSLPRTHSRASSSWAQASPQSNAPFLPAWHDLRPLLRTLRAWQEINKIQMHKNGPRTHDISLTPDPGHRLGTPVLVSPLLSATSFLVIPLWLLPFRLPPSLPSVSVFLRAICKMQPPLEPEKELLVFYRYLLSPSFSSVTEFQPAYDHTAEDCTSQTRLQSR